MNLLSINSLTISFQLYVSHLPAISSRLVFLSRNRSRFLDPVYVTSLTATPTQDILFLEYFCLLTINIVTLHRVSPTQNFTLWIFLLYTVPHNSKQTKFIHLEVCTHKNKENPIHNVKSQNHPKIQNIDHCRWKYYHQ